MRIVASDEAIALTRERGGSLYVSLKSRRCCHGAQIWLEAAHEPPDATEFDRVAGGEIEVYFPRSLGQRPDELHLEARGLSRRRVEAYWNGCAWVV